MNSSTKKDVPPISDSEQFTEEPNFFVINSKVGSKPFRDRSLEELREMAESIGVTSARELNREQLVELLTRHYSVNAV